MYIKKQTNNKPQSVAFEHFIFFFQSSKLKIYTSFVMKIKALDVTRTRNF